MQHDKLPFSQDDIVFNGHVIEARINAENPEKKFQPTPGKVKSYIYLKVSTYVSILCFILYQVSPYYDSLVAKVIVKDTNRKQL